MPNISHSENCKIMIESIDYYFNTNFVSKPARKSTQIVPQGFIQHFTVSIFSSLNVYILYILYLTRFACLRKSRKKQEAGISSTLVVNINPCYYVSIDIYALFKSRLSINLFGNLLLNSDQYILVLG